MIRAILLDVKSLVYGPTGADFLSEVLRSEGIGVEPVEVTEALAELPAELHQMRQSLRTEEHENDYHRTMLPALLERLGVPEPTHALLLRLVETVHQYHGFFSMYPETLPVLEELKQRGFSLAAVGNWEPSLHRFIREFELDGYFTAVLSSMEIGVAKPDPFFFGRALERLGCEAEEAWHVGSGLTEDVAGAMGAGICPIWLNRTRIPTDYEVLTILDLRGLLMLAPKVGS